jgi:hypothetical protein
MPGASDILTLLGVVVVAIVLVLVVRARHRSHAAWLKETAQREVCAHLRPALDLLLSRGHQVQRVGQYAPDLPLEIHLQPPFDPQELSAELKLPDPVQVSERNVLFCKEDWCELHPQRA